MHARMTGLLLMVLVSAWPAVAGLTVSIAAPKPKTVLYGTVQVVADVPADAAMTHGVLFIDDVGVCAGNGLPLVFEVDTTTLANGAHRLVAAAHNGYGAVAYSAPVTVVVMNPALDTGYLPRPTSSVPRPRNTSVPADGSLSVPPAPATPSRTTATDVAPRVSSLASGWTGSGLTITLDSQPLVFPVEPYMDQNRTMVMLRSLALAAGASIGWDGRAALVSWQARTYRFAPLAGFAQLDDQPIPLDRPIATRTGRIFVPVTAWRSCFSGRVVWQPEYQCVLLESPVRPTTASIPG